MKIATYNQLYPAYPAEATTHHKLAGDILKMRNQLPELLGKYLRNQ